MKRPRIAERKGMTYALSLTATFASLIVLAGVWFIRSCDTMLGRPAQAQA